MWKLEPSERIAQWRAFRKQLDLLTLEAALLAVAEFWHGCPFEPFYLEHNQPETWPNPWDLIADNYYCDLAKALGMLYTIYFTQHGVGLEAEIYIYKDPETEYLYNLVSLSNGKYVLNFRDCTVVNIESLNKNLTLEYYYSGDKLKLQQY